MDVKRIAAIATIVATVIAAISYLGKFGGLEQAGPLPSIATGGNHATATANGRGSNANASVNNSTTVIDNRVSVEGGGVAIGSGANINIITNNGSSK